MPLIKTKNFGDSESWLHRAYFFGDNAENEAKAYRDENCQSYTGYPGQSFARRGYIVAYGKRAIVRQSGGLDI
jgi:hypothetical protein